MKSKNLLMKSVFIFFVVLSIVGCASGPQYLTTNLKSLPLDQLSQLNIDLRTKDVQIDGIKVKSTKISLSPGAHLIKYKVYGESEYYKDFVRSMEEQGYSPNSDGQSFSRSEGGTTKTIRPLGGIKKYDWNEKSTNVTLEGGKTYNLSRL